MNLMARDSEKSMYRLFQGKMKKIYIASPLGFSEAGRFFLYKKLIPVIEKIGFRILDPWKLTDESKIRAVTEITSLEERKKAWEKLNIIIGQNNEEAINSSDLLLAVLDGTDIDSGTAAEIGYASARDKQIIGYRGDFRLTGDNEGSMINLQVEYFISKTGGKTVSTLEELEILLKKYQ